MKSQEQYPTCGAHAGSALQSILATKFDNCSPKYLLRRIKQIDGYPLEAGTDMRSILKALQSYGDCTEAFSPDTIDPTLPEYSDVKQIVPPMDKSAALYKIDGYGFIDKPSMAQIKQAIFQIGAVIPLVDIGDGWWANGRAEAATCPLKLGIPVGHHFVVFYGYDETFICGRNSFGRDWGRNGDFYFDASYVPHILEIGTAVPNVSVRQQFIAASRASSLPAPLDHSRSHGRFLQRAPLLSSVVHFVLRTSLDDAASFESRRPQFFYTSPQPPLE